MKLTTKQKNFLRLHSEIVVECLPEDLEIEGNASAIDPETDAAIAQEIRDQLEAGNEWAWCCIMVSVSWKGFEGVDYLGACSYKSKADFMESDGYFPDMVARAFDELVEAIESDMENMLTLWEQEKLA